MKKFLVSFSCLLVALAALPPAAHGQQRKRAPKRPPAGARKLPPERVLIRPTYPDAGSFAGGVYTNAYFGLVLVLPEGWQVVDRDTEAVLHKKGGELMAGDSAEMRAEIEAGGERSLSLFTLVKLLPAERGGTPVTVMGMAEAVEASMFPTAESYLAQVRRLFEAAAVKTEFDGPVTKEKIGGVEFASLKIRQVFNGTTIRQRISCARRLGHVLTLTRAYVNDSDTEVLDEVVKTIKFY